MRACSAIHHPGRPTFRVKARFRDGSGTVSRGQGAAAILVMSRLASPGLFSIHRHQPRPTIVSCCTTRSTTRRRVSTFPSPRDHLIIFSPDLEHHMQVSGGVEEHMAADRLHRAMATVFETCSSVLEGWKNAGLTRTNSKHRTSMVCSPCLELYPDEHEIQSDSWDRIAYFR